MHTLLRITSVASTGFSLAASFTPSSIRHHHSCVLSSTSTSFGFHTTNSRKSGNKHHDLYESSSLSSFADVALSKNTRIRCVTGGGFVDSQLPSLSFQSKSMIPSSQFRLFSSFDELDNDELYDDDDDTQGKGSMEGGDRKFHKNPNQLVEKDEWMIPKSLTIPEDQLDFTYVRSSGSGGQNVNKVNSQVQVRFHVLNAKWIPIEVRERILQQQYNKINNDGYYILAVQEHRTQVGNKKVALEKLEDMILSAWARPKIRKIRTEVSESTKEKRKIEKQHRKLKKERRSNRFDNYD